MPIKKNESFQNTPSIACFVPLPLTHCTGSSKLEAFFMRAAFVQYFSKSNPNQLAYLELFIFKKFETFVDVCEMLYFL